MLQSQMNLDHRLAELRQLADEIRQAQAARASGKPGRSVAATIRSLLSGSLPARRARLATN